MQPRLGHERKQPRGLERDRLSAGIGAGEHQASFAFGEPERERHRGRGFARNARAGGDFGDQKGMAGIVEPQLALLAKDRGFSAADLGKPPFGLRQIDLRQQRKPRRRRPPAAAAPAP